MCIGIELLNLDHFIQQTLEVLTRGGIIDIKLELFSKKCVDKDVSSNNLRIKIVDKVRFFQLGEIIHKVINLLHLSDWAHVAFFNKFHLLEFLEGQNLGPTFLSSVCQRLAWVGASIINSYRLLRKDIKGFVVKAKEVFLSELRVAIEAYASLVFRDFFHKV